eukprot:g55194.t1
MGGQLWAVSQAAPVRRVHVKGDMYLHDKGAQASGGHMANVVVEGKLSFGSQQQWCCRSVDIKEHDLCAWSSVFVDCKGGPEQSGVQKQDGRVVKSVTVDASPKVTVEKPFVVLKDVTRQAFELRIPKPRIRDGGAGPLGADLIGNEDVRVDFSHVRVAIPTDTTQQLNQALKAGKHLLLCPGVYNLSEPLEITHHDQPLEITHHDQVVLGIGQATLVAPRDGRPCIKVAARTAGVRVAGLMLEASVIPKEREFVASLIEWGEEKVSDAGQRDRPGVLSDIFARVGSLQRDVTTDVMVRIHSGHVYGDNLWLWRADHVALDQQHGEKPNFPPLDYHQVTLGEVPCKTGLEVTGDDVTIHGLAVEHTTEHQTIWRGKRGNVQFYQCELPYDVKESFKDYLGYYVTQEACDETEKEKEVAHHTAGGLGIYCNFRDYTVPVETAIRHPEKSGFHFTNPFTVHLNNNGVIKSIINGQGKWING